MTAEHLPKFFRKAKNGARGFASDQRDGIAIFIRLNDGGRLDLVTALIDAWDNDESWNTAIYGGALRQAWESEPYINGRRMGSYISAVAAARASQGVMWSMAEFVEEWGPAMMTSAEMRQLQAMDFPLTVYRGGTGTFEEVAQGVSWTLKPEVAAFYASTWPKRWGDEREPLILSMEVEEDDVHAYLDGRDEAELLIPYSTDLMDSMHVVDIEEFAAKVA